jgi:hypothetical protein
MTMAKLSLLSRKRVEVPCTVEINNTFDQLGAHVRFDNGVVVYPGDEVMVHGAPVEVPYGQCESFRRTATITRASRLSAPGRAPPAISNSWNCANSASQKGQRMNKHVDPKNGNTQAVPVNETTKTALESTMLNPRFYTTDFDALDSIDVSSVRREWDELIAEMKSDPNKGHFKRNETGTMSTSKACRKACARSSSTSWSVR